MRAPRAIAAGRWRRRTAATLALVIAVAVVIAVILGTRSPGTLNAAANKNRSSGSTTVERRDLVQTDTESGTLSYARPQTVYDRLTGTITWLPAVGQVIHPGQALFRVNGAPVALLNGGTPAYRDLGPSDSAGQDVLQLNRNLVALGFNPDGIVVDDVWQAATTAGVELFQESLGETETGTLTLGQIVFLPGAQVVSTVNGTVGSNGSGGNGSNASDPRGGSPAAEYVDLTTTTPTSPNLGKPKKRHKPHHNQGSAQTIATLKALLKAATAQLRAETAELKAAHNGSGPNGEDGNSPNGGNSANSNNSGNSGNSANSNNSNNSGDRGGNATAILQTSSTQLVVTVDLDATKQSEAKVGEKVTVELPNGSTVNGRIAAVSSVAQSSNDNGNSGNGGATTGTATTATTRAPPRSRSRSR